jgi:ribosomal protein S12 methylthiotransferase
VQIQDGERMGLKPGQFVDVTIMGADEHDLFALVDPDNADF